MLINEQLNQTVCARVERARAEIERSLKWVDLGNPLASEPDTTRLINRLKTKASLSREEAESIATGIKAFSTMSPKQRAAFTKTRGPEAIWGNTIDFVSIAFLERGQTAAKSVGRVAFRDGRAQGSGFLISNRLFLTNNHVIPSKQAAQQFCVEFDYELDPQDRPRGPSRFALASDIFFETDDVNDLDYTLIAIGDRLSGPRTVEEFGWCALSDASDKHALGEVANIVQHPDGRYKEVVLRENRLVSRLDFALHYVADTEPGSSGSPVFNNEWRVIALHHWGGPWRQKTNAQGHAVPREINEGIRISAIVSELRQRLPGMASGLRALLQQALDLDRHDAVRPSDERRNLPTPSYSARVGPDGRVTWQIPLEISVGLPGLIQGSVATATAPAVSSSLTNAAASTSEVKVKPSKNYNDRSGYKPRFISEFTIQLPTLSESQKRQAAVNKERQPGDDPYELMYHHFSVVMNRTRRLAFFTACNIDGASAKHVDRTTGNVSPLRADDPHLAENLEMQEGAEASESWYDDARLDPQDYAGRDIYEKQVVPGFLDTRSMARTLRMFQRGHLVRRMDPAWGTDQQALLADADTFHWTNCSPQVGFFNMGKAPRKPGTGGGKLWRAIENYVLRNAVADEMRVSSFTGPIFSAQDRDFRDIKVPGRFWKIVVWAERGALRSLAMIADQRPVISVWPEALGEAAEAYGDLDELDRVRDFVTTVNEIERLTHLNFGPDVNQADIRSGESTDRVGDFSDISTRLGQFRKRKRTGSTRRQRKP